MSIKVVKYHFLVIFLSLFLLNTMSASAEFKPAAVDTMKQEMSWFDKNDTIHFFPVCGEDGYTYINPLEAQSFGVDSWTAGRCNTYTQVLSIDPTSIWIEKITLNEASNTSISNPLGFSDYTNIVLEVFKEKENTLHYKTNTTKQNQTSGISIWIDFDKSGTFDKSEMLGNENIVNNESNISFVIPSSIEPNLMTRMRIVCSKKDAYPVNGFIAEGEVEDYSIIIVE